MPRRAVLVDHPPGVEAAQRGREGAHRRRHHPGLGGLGALPGEFRRKEMVVEVVNN